MAMRLFATRMPISSPISLTVLTKRAAVRSIFSRTRAAVDSIVSEAQSRRLSPSVTVRMSRCSISVMRTVCRISACVYSIKISGRGLTRIDTNALGKILIRVYPRSSAAEFFAVVSSHNLTQYEQDYENNEQSDGHQHKTQTGIIVSFFEHHA